MKRGPAMMVAAPVLFCIALAAGTELSACAHAPPVLVVTGEVLHAAKLSMVATEAGMRAANQQGLLTAAQREAWNAFEPKFVKSWGAACDVWEAAEAAQDQSMKGQVLVIITALLGELATFTELLVELHPVDGGGS